MRQIAAIRRNCEKIIATDWVNADEPCTEILQYVQSVAGRVVNYDATIFNYDLEAIQSPYNAYLMDFIDGKVSNAKAQELYNNLHINNSTKNPKFIGGNNDVYEAIYPEEYIDWTHFYDSMLTLNGGIDVLVYAGAYDQ